MADASKLIFLGTGSSTGVPTPNCVLSFEGACSVCADALQRGSSSTNYRTNPSILIVRKHSEGKRELCSRFSAVNNSDDDATIVQIDITKHFREQVLSSWCYHGVRHLDALVLSHTYVAPCFLAPCLQLPGPRFLSGSKKRLAKIINSEERQGLKFTCVYFILRLSDMQMLALAWTIWYVYEKHEMILFLYSFSRRSDLHHLVCVNS